MCCSHGRAMMRLLKQGQQNQKKCPTFTPEMVPETDFPKMLWQVASGAAGR